MFGALKRGRFRSLASLILVVNVVGELQQKRTLAASRGFLAAARLSCIQFKHTIKLYGLRRVTYENMFMGDCSFLSLVRDPTGAIVPKNIVPRDRSRGGRKSDLNLFYL